MRRLLLAGTAAVLILAGCSSDSNDATSEVATLLADDEGVGDAADAATRANAEAADGDDLTPDGAALEFSQCMRDEGLDFPDLGVDAEGNIDLRDAFQSTDQDQEGFREAAESCREILEQGGFGGGGGLRQALDSPSVQDALLEFSACVREAGYDVGDLTLSGGPGGPPAGGAGQDGAADDQAQGGQGQGEGGSQGQEGQGQEGQRRGGFGDRGARFAEQLGLDYEDPAVQETIDGCMSIIDDAFATVLDQPTDGG